MTILWLKALHVFFMLAWMAGIFYLPRLFVYFAESSHQETRDTLKVMQRRLWFFVTPFALLTLIFGVWLIVSYGSAWLAASAWLHAKLVLVFALYAYHIYLYMIMRDLAQDKNIKTPKFYRILNEMPVLGVLAIVVFAVVKPF